MTNATFAYDAEARTVRGLLLPFGQLSRRSATTDPITFSKDAVRLPRDASVVTLNRDHDQHQPIGRALSVEATDEGVVATFSIANTDEGDAALADIKAGKVTRLSAEVRGLTRRGSRAVSSSLTGAALTPMGAFEGAALFSLAEGEEEQVEEAVEEAVTEEAPEVAPEAVEAIVAAVVERLTETPDADPGAENTNTESEFSMTDAIVPAGVFEPPAKRKTTTSGLFAAIAAKDSEALSGYAAAGGDLFAIANIQHSGPSAVTIGADTAEQGYLGELWTNRPYQRKYVPLFSSRPLTSYTAVGWTWDPGNSPEVGAYSGNVSEVSSNAVDTIQKTVTASRVAGGNKIDRRFLDFPDQGVIASYFDKMTEHYARYTDAAALAAAVSGAGADLTVTGNTYPYGSPVAIAAIVDGALSVIASENTPSFAVVSPELWREIVLTGKEQTLGYLNAGFGLEEGTAGGFQIIPGAVGTGKVLVGAREAMTVFELPGSPIRVEGIDPHNGAIDPAIFGYYATLVNNAAALSIVDTTDYTAPEPPIVVTVEGA